MPCRSPAMHLGVGVGVRIAACRWLHQLSCNLLAQPSACELPGWIHHVEVPRTAGSTLGQNEPGTTPSVMIRDGSSFAIGQSHPRSVTPRRGSMPVTTVTGLRTGWAEPGTPGYRSRVLHIIERIVPIR